MRLTKKRAKMILLYLLNRNIDLSEMSEIVDIDVVDGRLKYREDCSTYDMYVYDGDFCHFNGQETKRIVTENLKSLSTLIKMLFKYANDGYAIESSLYKDDEPLIYANESLEQVMIEMDLNRLEEK